MRTFYSIVFMKTEKTDKSQELPRSINDAAWGTILPFLQACPNVYVGNPENCRRFLSALVWMTKEGTTWRAIPKVYGYWNTIYHRFGRWCDIGVFQALHEHFHDVGEISAILLHRLKQYHRVATRYEKYAVRYLGFVYFASILMAR
ncbi:MAG: transposase [Candidatus Poribacteria bacterium]|nr:transposase [Candidatus Poribacteria bacterium]